MDREATEVTGTGTVTTAGVGRDGRPEGPGDDGRSRAGRKPGREAAAARRTRRRFARRQWARRWLSLRYVLAFLLILVLVGTSVYLVFFSTTLQVKRVEVVGRLAGDPVDVYVNDRHVAKGEVLVLNDNFCVRINEIVSTGVE